VFYVGWKQHSETFLNAGYDINTPNKGRQFYWLNGSWIQSQFNGSIMIRPVVGHKLKTTSSDDSEAIDKKSFRLWPNPASGYINLEYDDLLSLRSAFISIIDLFGREAMRVPYNERINISTLKPGVYTVIAISGNKRIGFTRLVKSR
jgi:hypothetical protein